MKKAALYLRVSSATQAKEGESIPTQLAALREYAGSHNMQIVGEYIDDGISGTKYSERDELQRMLTDIEAGGIDIILVTKLDRFFRSIRWYIATQEILNAHGVNWLAIWEPIYNTTTPQGRLIINQMLSIAQFEAEQTGQRIRQVQAYKVTQREVISGNVTPGYRIENKRLALDPDRAEAVRLAFETFNRTGNLAETIRATYGMGLPTSHNGIKRLLKREVYTGRCYGMDDFAPAIIDRQLFESVQRQLSMHTRSRSKRVNLFSGLIRCGECGAVMASLYRKPKPGHSGYTCYRCPKHYQQAVKVCDNAKVISENALERQLIDQLPALIVEHVEAEEKKRLPAADARKQREAIQRKVERLKELYINELITLEEYKADKAKLTAALDNIPINEDTAERPSEAIRELLGLNVKEVYAKMERAEKRLFWRSIIREIRFSKEREFRFIFL